MKVYNNTNENLIVGDKIIICIIIILTLVLQMSLINTKVIGQRRIITIRVDQNRQSYKYNMNDTQRIKFKFEEHDGVLVFDKGRVRMERMDLKICPKQICSKTGWIEYDYQSIVCLPNKIMITIEGNVAEPVNRISEKLLDNIQEVFL
jgi:hypothetical protein